MKLWQKIFLPSVAFTMIGIFAVSMSFVINSHTLQLEAQKDAILSKSSEVATELTKSVEARKKGYFLSSAIMEGILRDACLAMDDEDTQVSAFLLDPAVYPDKNDVFFFFEDTGSIQFQTSVFISGRICEIHILKDIRPLLNRFQEDMRTVQIYGVIASLAVSIAMLLLAVMITKPVKNLERATEQISAGDYSYRIRYKGKDELSELAQHMNRMAAHIEENTAYIESISDSRRKFIANMTHELKTPLTSILGFADVLRIKPDISDEERRDYGDIIFAEAKRLRTLSSRLMELITVSETQLHMMQVDVALLLMREIEMYRPICEEADISLTADLEPAMVMVDETLFATMIVNLIDNARKASAAGNEIAVRCKKKGHRVLIQIRDYGIGIPQEQIAYVTEAFYMVDKARTRKAGGAGIGLALCKAIASAHNGELSIQSRLNAGTTVTVWIPLYEEDKMI